MTFEPDTKVATVAEAYAIDAIDVAKRNFGINLDGSEPSVAEVERVLGTLHRRYVGEVVRRHRGGVRGFSGGDGEEQRYALERNGPQARVYGRTVDGPENNTEMPRRLIADG